MPKKNKAIIIITIIIVILLIIGRALYLYIKNQKKEINSVNDFNNIKEIVEFNECKYIKTVDSKEEGYKKDIYIQFSKGPINEHGETSEILYDNLTSQIAGKIVGTNFRIIDESKDIIIRVQFEEKTVKTYTINNDAKFFEHLKTKYQAQNYKEDKTTILTTNSSELNAIINNNWSTQNLNLGTIESVFNSYNIYFDEGYKIRNLYSKVYNIIFTEKYNKEILPGIKVGMNLKQIEEILGKATFYNEENNLIGYKSEEYYIFFSKDEISIYRNEQNYDSLQFYNLLKEYNETKDYNTFISKVTDLWPDYDTFTKTSNRINLQYTLKGITIDFNSIDNNGVTVYKNCKGQLMDEIKKGNSIGNLYTNLDNDLVVEKEISRIVGEEMMRNPVDPITELDTDKYSFICSKTANGGYLDVKLYSKDKKSIDIELKDKYINNIFKFDENNYIYSVEGRGIYRLDINRRQYQTIVEGQDAFKINKIENNIIYYDGKQIEVK